MAPFQGYGSFLVRKPRVAPWAIEYDPFRVDKRGRKRVKKSWTTSKGEGIKGHVTTAGADRRSTVGVPPSPHTALSANTRSTRRPLRRARPDRSGRTEIFQSRGHRA